MNDVTYLSNKETIVKLKTLKTQIKLYIPTTETLANIKEKSFNPTQESVNLKN